MVTTQHPYHPIIYVRGFAATQGEIEETVADPYMGFNIGSTKTRVAWTGDVKRFYFESPLVRLMSDHGYEDVFVDGDDLLAAERADHPIPYRCIVIYRYYDEASKDFGDGKTPPIEHFAKGLGNLILRLREKTSANKDNKITPNDFRVHLIAHSMGGLVCRAFLQNPNLGSAEARGAVDKLFTYATPHNGIDMRIVRNVPGWLSFGDINNFNREKMAKYLAVPKGDDVSVVKNFPPERIFNLVGINPGDYTVAGGLSAWAAGDASDGLVRIENATTHGPGLDGKDVSSPRAFVHRSHSGHYGIVNSEEGYQKPHALPVWRVADGWHPGHRRHHPSGGGAEGARRRQGRACVVSVRGGGQRARLSVATDTSRGARELRDLPKLRRAVSRGGSHQACARPHEESAPLLAFSRSEEERQGIQIGQLRF
jgi:PGAP1-like protein